MAQVKNSFLYSFQSAAKVQAQLYHIYEVTEELGLLEEDEHENGFYFYYSHYGEPSITLNCYAVMLTPAAEVMAQWAKKLLIKLGTLDKGFDESLNQLELTGMYKGVKIILTARPPKTCTVETVVEEVEVPEQVIPAHTEKKTRYVLKGDCDPLLQPTEPTEPAAPVVDATAESSTEVPF